MAAAVATSAEIIPSLMTATEGSSGMAAAAAGQASTANTTKHAVKRFISSPPPSGRFSAFILCVTGKN
jgi:hypothetical protein